VAEAMRPLAGKACHLCLSPDMILVDIDAQGYYRPLPLDLGLVISKLEREEGRTFWLQFSDPAYTAPELISLEKKVAAISPPADTYSLGMVLREMLVGQPAFVSKLARDSEVQEAVRRYRGVLSLNRPELPKEVSTIVEKALAQSPAERYSDLNHFASALRKVFGRPPKEVMPRPVGQWVVLGFAVIAIVALVVILGLVTYFQLTA
jgi:serine/threonine protein kinase